jgi:hypothetical protein
MLRRTIKACGAGGSLCALRCVSLTHALRTQKLRFHRESLTIEMFFQ